MAYYYKIVKEKKSNVLYRVEVKRRVKLAADHAGDGLIQLNRMKALFETTKLPIKKIREAEALIAGVQVGRGSNWAGHGKPIQVQ